MTDRRIALFGAPGAGKSTSSNLLEQICRERSIGFHRVKLAEPLYYCQAAIYQIADRPLADRYTQDGELLNFLGAHLRKINPTVLIDRFRERVEAISAVQTGATPAATLTVCDDMRAVDAPPLRAMGFTFVRLTADPALCRQRRAGRGDASLGSHTHPTEQGLDGVQHDFTVANEGTLSELEARLESFLEALLR